MAEQRDHGFVIRVTEAERDVWHAAARSAGWSKTAGWARETLSGAATGRVPATSERRVFDPVLATIRVELGRIGGNVNQIARAVNRHAKSGQLSDVVVELGENLAAIRAELGAIRTLLAERGDQQ